MKEFWYVDKKGNYEVKQNQILRFLEFQGFRNAKIENQWFVVRVSNHVIDIINDTLEVRHYLVKYIKSKKSQVDQDQIIEKVLGLFKLVKRTGLLDGLSILEMELLEGDESTTYKFFRNGVVKITATQIELLDYDLLEGSVMRSSIIERDIHLQTEIEIWKSDFSKFLYRCMMANNTSYFALISTLGYLSSNYKTAKDNKAVIFCDDNMEGIPEGGTGKSLTALALSQFNNSVMEDGKNFQHSNFTFQQIKPETNLLIIDDAGRKFNFENLFSSITNGLQVEKKYQDKYMLSFQDSPKILITTNYTIYGRGYSFERRVVEIEFSNYYGKDIIPLNEFGHEFFTSWNDEQWNSFYNFMSACVSYYLKNGIVEASFNDQDEKKLRRETNIDFVEFISEYELKNWIKKADLYEAFINDYPNYKTWLSIRKFNEWVKIYCHTKEIDFQEQKRNDGQRHWVFS